MDELLPTEPVVAPESAVPFLAEAVVFLIAAVVIVPLFRRFQVSPVLGYLAAGMTVGPFGLKVVGDVEGVRSLAELGIVFLLFTIGLELSINRLRAMRNYVFGLGSLQVLVTATTIGAIAAAYGNPPEAAMVIGLCLALSSTAIVLQLLVERGDLATRHGRAAFSVLLFQDLAVVPILILVSVLAASGEKSIAELGGEALLKAIAAIGLILFVGRFLLRGVFHAVAAARTPELFVAMTLLTVLAIAWATELAGLSMALGAFLAGLLLSDTEFRHQIETDIAPFKGLMLGLFFMSIGIGLDLNTLETSGGLVVLSVGGLIAIKALILIALASGFGLTLPQAVRCGLLLSAGGEFAFIVLTQAAESDVIPHSTEQFMLAVATLSMMLTPLLEEGSRVLSRLIARPESGDSPPSPTSEVADLEGHVVIIGFGRVGRTIARLLRERKFPFIALDLDPGVTRNARRDGLPVFYANVNNTDVLDHVKAGRAAALVIALSDHAGSLAILQAVRRRWPGLNVFVRARDETLAKEFARHGATAIVPETLESSLQLSGQVLRSLGESSDSVNALIELIRAEGYAPIVALSEEKKAEATP